MGTGAEYCMGMDIYNSGNSFDGSCDYLYFQIIYVRAQAVQLLRLHIFAQGELFPFFVRAR